MYDLPILERIKLANLWLAAQITDSDHKETGKCSSKWFDLCFYLSKLPGDILQDFIGLLHSFDTIKSLISHQQMFEEVSSLKILLKALISIWWQKYAVFLIMYASIFLINFSTFMFVIHFERHENHTNMWHLFLRKVAQKKSNVLKQFFELAQWLEKSWTYCNIELFCIFFHSTFFVFE